MIVERKNGSFCLYGKIDTTNAPTAEAELFALYEGGPAVIDAKELDYISSAGLRIIMKLRRKTDDITILNANSTVYEILEVTGFSELIRVKRALRFVSVEGLEKIGQGAHGRVYRLTDDTIIKTYYDDSSLSVIDQEREFCKNAFVCGVPCAIAFDVVECEEGYGVVLETAGSVSLSKFLTEHPERLEEYGLKYAELLRSMHDIPAKTGLYGSVKDIFVERAENAAPYFTDEENRIIRELFDAIPDRRTLVHGDYHPGNVMVNADGELLLIDMADVSYGNPLYDIGGTCLSMLLGGQRDPEVVRKTTGLEYGLSVKLWNVFLSAYYETTDPALLEKLTRRCAAFGLLRMASAIGMKTEFGARMAPGMVALLRQSLFPVADSFRALLATELV